MHYTCGTHGQTLKTALKKYTALEKRHLWPSSSRSSNIDVLQWVLGEMCESQSSVLKGPSILAGASSGELIQPFSCGWQSHCSNPISDMRPARGMHKIKRWQISLRSRFWYFWPVHFFLKLMKFRSCMTKRCYRWYISRSWRKDRNIRYEILESINKRKIAEAPDLYLGLRYRRKKMSLRLVSGTCFSPYLTLHSTIEKTNVQSIEIVR